MAKIKLWSNGRHRPVLSGLCACLVGLGSPSCGSWSGNPPSSKVQTGTTAPVEKQGTVEIVIQGTNTSLRLINNKLSVVDKSGKAAGQIELSSVQLMIADITVRRDASDLTTRPKLAGPFVLDLLTNTITPTPDKLTLPEGDYKDISFQLYKQAGGSVQLKGVYTAANMKTSNIKITLDADDQISLMKEAQARIIQVASASNQQVAISFQLDQWFNFNGKDTDLTSATGADLTIDTTATGDGKKLRDAFLSNVKTATDFGKYEVPAPSTDVPKKDDKDDDDDRRNNDSSRNGR